MAKCNIVLFQPEIPANTGNIARTCIGFNMTLHLIKPYGFSIDDKQLKRAGLDYWKFLDLCQYDDFESFLSKNNNPKIYIITKFGDKLLTDIESDFEKDVFFLFGRETKGLPKEIMEAYGEAAIRIPMRDIRSFNLSNTVAMVAHHFVMKNKYVNLK